MMEMETDMDADMELEFELEAKVESLSITTAPTEPKVHLNENNCEQSANHSAAEAETTLSVVDKLQRFCYLGTLEMPIYVPPSLDLMVDSHFSTVLELCKEVKHNDLIDCLSQVLSYTNAARLPRRDEALLILAIFLSTCVDEKERTLARGHFAMLVTSGTDLLLFVKFVKRVQSLLGRKTPFSRTIRKAVIDWYKLQPLEKLLALWVQHDCGHSAHRDLLYHCHYTNEKFDADIEAALRLIFLPAHEVILWPEELDPLNNFKDPIMAVARVRLAQSFEEALPIVEQFSLGFHEVPRNLMIEPNMVKTMLTKMSYDQLITTWLSFVNVFKLHPYDMQNYIKLFFDRSKLREANVHPVRLLLQDARGIKRKRNRSKKSAADAEPSFMYNLFRRSFGENKALGLRLHITINLEMCYIGKYLNGRWRSISYLDAVLAFGFGYYKTEAQASVQIWFDKSGKLKPLSWTPTMSFDEAKHCCQMQKVLKIKQTLTDVIDNALHDATNTYDAFLVLLPSATRGNPKKNSDELHRRLNEYRQTRNPKAKFIIMSLRENHGSMSYSKERKENILEICGISEEMPRLINAFANDKFI